MIRPTVYTKTGTRLSCLVFNFVVCNASENVSRRNRKRTQIILYHPPLEGLLSDEDDEEHVLIAVNESISLLILAARQEPLRQLLLPRLRPQLVRCTC